MVMNHRLILGVKHGVKHGVKFKLSRIRRVRRISRIRKRSLQANTNG